MRHHRGGLGNRARDDFDLKRGLTRDDDTTWRRALSSCWHNLKVGHESMRTDFLSPETARWTDLLSGLRHDVYHLPAYVAFGARRQVEGEPLAFIAEENGSRLLIPIIVRSIPPDLAGERQQLRDSTSPKGYSGPLIAVDSDRTPNFSTRALAAFRNALLEARIVTAFVRMHPLLETPAGVLERAGAVVEHGDSVSIDLTLSTEELWRLTRANHRRDINNARRRGYVARIDESWSSFDAFVRVYQESMDRLGAAAFWRLSREYFLDLKASLGSSLRLCVVEQGEEVAAAGLLTEVDGIVEYHLAGTADAHVAASPSKLIVDFARSWAKSRGNRHLHLGGSLRKGDSLYHFKTGFSPRQHSVSSWRVVADESAYRSLVDRWEASHAKPADALSGYFPAYRKPGGARW